MKFYGIKLLNGENHMSHNGIGLVKNFFKISLDGKFTLNQSFLFSLLSRKEMSLVTGRAGNAIDTEQELAEFQTTHEV
jgi:hypothetical protein